MDPDLLNTLKDAVHIVTLRDSGNIDSRTKISELGLNSTTLTELIGILEKNFSIRINNKETALITSVGDLLSLVRNRIPSGNRFPGSECLAGNSAKNQYGISGNGARCDIAQFPEVKKLGRRLDEFDRAGVKNPYFEVHDSIARNRTSIGGVEMLNFSSYNYLGFSGHPKVMKAAKDAIDRYGTSVSASRLVSGERPIHRKLEKALADHVGVDDAVVFVSGHATNVTTIGHLFDHNDLILHDSLSHDSIVQGIYLSGSKRKSYLHNNMDHLESLLERIRDHYRRVLICSEGLFSMDGDICNLPRLIEIKKRFHCNLIIDEAHSIGVLGPGGRGVSHHFPGIDQKDVDIWMGTLSKSFAGCGPKIPRHK